MKVLVLRPERAGVRTAEALRGLGHEPILAPVLAIEDLDSAIPDIAYDAVLATSANGLRKLARRPEIASLSRLPLIAVGDRTAEAGREAGFADVHVAEGDGRALVAEAKVRFAAPARFLHAAGADRAFDIAGALNAEGYDVTVVELYRASAATSLPEPARAALASGEIDVVLHHSGRIAENFLRLSVEAGLGDAARAVAHVALAGRIASALKDFGCLRVATAARPDEASLFEAMALLAPARSPS